MFFTEDITLSTLICDEDDKLTLWGLARLFQDVAGDNSDMLGVGFEGLKPLNKAWILTHVYYNILRLPTAGERLTLRTWAKPDNGLIAPRDYQLIDADGNICATSASNWVILDMTSRRVSRLYEISAKYDKETLHATKYEKLDKIKMPSDLVELKHINVPYSSIDHTRHVNNAEYIKWICDAIPELCGSRFLFENGISTPNPQRHEILEFEINYLKETKYGDQNVILLASPSSFASASSLSALEHPSSQDSVCSKDSICSHDSVCSQDSLPSEDSPLFIQIQNSHGISVNAKIHII